MEPFAFDVSRTGVDVRVVVHGELDMLAAPPLLALLDDLAQDAGHLVIDLRSADFIDSSGFSALVRAHRRFGARVSLVRPVGQVARALAVSGLDQLVPFVDAPAP